MKNIKLSEKDRKHLTTSVRRVIGQLRNVEKELEEDTIGDHTFTQLLAVKGGTSKICKEIISRGVIENLQNYSRKEIDQALDVIFKLD
jgi:DNA-binding FrmR family transcriptional regulator